MRIEFESTVYRWAARLDADWYFVEMPADPSDLISQAHAHLRRGFGAVRVRATIGGTTWRTSIFPDAQGLYSLPLKRAVRDAENLHEGAPTAVVLEIVDV